MSEYLGHSGGGVDYLKEELKMMTNSSSERFRRPNKFVNWQLTATLTNETNQRFRMHYQALRNLLHVSSSYSLSSSSFHVALFDICPISQSR